MYKYEKSNIQEKILQIINRIYKKNSKKITEYIGIQIDTCNKEAILIFKFTFFKIIIRKRNTNEKINFEKCL